jgi:putative sugar O-methyltransferase
MRDDHAARISRFWARLANEQQSDLAEFGYEVLKRSQALRYFTWRWRPSGLRSSEQFRFLVARTGPAVWWRTLREPTVPGSAQWAPARWTRFERRVYTYATRLAWDYAVRYGDPEVIALEEPKLGSPFPVMGGERLISQDLANTALEVAAIRQGLAYEQPRSIFEIGGGYGRTAHALLSLFPEARYTIVDIEPALSISRWYLERLLPAERLRFVEFGQVDSLVSDEFDLALSISSLQEMTPEVVASYFALMDRCVAGSVYLKQWTSWRNPVDEVISRFSDYPVPARWRLTFSRAAPIQTRFTEAMWTTGRA